jgi:hypothetical protein
MTQTHPLPSSIRIGVHESGEQPWIDWAGGEQPVPDDTRVETESRGFGIMPACYADSVDWKHRPIARLDVIAYRVVSA